MGIRHVVVFKFVEGVSDATVAEVAERLRKLPAAIPEIKAYSFGADLGLAEGNFDFAVVADFETHDDWVSYRDHPVHRDVIADLIAPNVATRSAVQINT